MTVTAFILLAIGLIGTVIAWMIVRTARITLRSMTALQARIEPVLAPLREGRTPSPDQIHALAASADTRSLLHRALRDMKREDLFPPQYATAEALAESDLVVWLWHDNELGARPDGIEHVKTIERPEGAPGSPGRYLLFRFRTDPPHWAADSGWMAGVAGPYFEGDEAFEAPHARVFSKFEKFESRSPEEHVEAMVQMMKAK
jgi:hypothetical protein